MGVSDETDLLCLDAPEGMADDEARRPAPHRDRPMSGRAPHPLEAVEDDIEAVLELVPEVVAGLHDVFGEHLDEIGVFVKGKGWSMLCATSAISCEVSNGRFIFVRAKP